MTGIKKVRQSVNTSSLSPLRLLRRTEAAKHIQDKWGYPCSPRTLAKYAVTGGGPPFRKAGRYPLYHPDDLDCWVGGKLSDPVTSTSELSNQQSEREAALWATQGCVVSKSKANKMGMAVPGQQKDGAHVERRGGQRSEISRRARANARVKVHQSRRSRRDEELRGRLRELERESDERKPTAYHEAGHAVIGLAVAGRIRRFRPEWAGKGGPCRNGP